jgi:hypothetical protein
MWNKLELKPDIPGLYVTWSHIYGLRELNYIKGHWYNTPDDTRLKDYSVDFWAHLPTESFNKSIASYNDGSSVYLSSYTGDGHPNGEWAELELRFTSPNGSEIIRKYRDVSLPQKRVVYFKGPLNEIISMSDRKKWGY